MITCPKPGLNPLSKLVLLVSFCVLALRAESPGHAAVPCGAVLLAHAAIGLPPAILWRRLRGIAVFALVLFLSQLFLTGGGAPWGVRAASGVRMAMRFLNIILGSHLFVSTTSAEDLAYTLMRLGLSYRYGFTLLIAMRFVPYFRLQSNTVLQAQMVRGIGVDRPSIKGVWCMARYTLVPLVVTALGRVESLAISMEGRCFGLHPRRTFLRTVPFRPVDALIIAGAIAVVGAAAAIL
ncbi:MAG: energy-coupling factor transporter transmembrane protein EcfT [Firmicutes bacterium]|nr:energy-coupling factor transporter transmembrane protein EcfT [Bacillota bacterium]